MSLEERPRPDPRDATPREYRALGVLAVLAGLTFLRLAIPVGTGVFLGALIAFTIYPLHVVLRRWTGRNDRAALLCAALTWLGATAGIGGLFYLLIDRGAMVAQKLPAVLAPDGPVDRKAAEIGARLHAFGMESDALEHHVHHAAEELSSYAGGFVGAAMSTTLGLLVALFFTVVTVHCVLSHWARLAHWTEALLPLRPMHTRQLLVQVRSLGREIVLGTVMVGLAQGVLAGVGYAVLGVPQAPFFGAMTAVASTIPVLGTMLVWAPLGAYLILTGHTGAGVAELVWGFLVVVTLSDGFLRPRLVGSRSHMGLLPALIGLFGGIELFGFVGLLLGPTLVGLALAILRLYARARARNAALEHHREDGQVRVLRRPKGIGVR